MRASQNLVIVIAAVIGAIATIVAALISTGHTSSSPVAPVPPISSTYLLGIWNFTGHSGAQNGYGVVEFLGNGSYYMNIVTGGKPFHDRGIYQLYIVEKQLALRSTLLVNKVASYALTNVEPNSFHAGNGLDSFDFKRHP